MAVQLYDVKYKVLLLGDAGVGKTSLIRKLMGQQLQNNYMCTIGKKYIIFQFSPSQLTFNSLILERKML